MLIMFHVVDFGCVVGYFGDLGSVVMLVMFPAFFQL